jgi:hypothetical protein
MGKVKLARNQDTGEQVRALIPRRIRRNRKISAAWEFGKPNFRVLS